MARRNGIHSRDTGSRKKLVQPVLPALPLLPRARRETSKAKEEDNASKSETAPLQHTVTKIQEEQKPETIANETNLVSNTKEVEVSGQGLTDVVDSVDVATDNSEAAQQETHVTPIPRLPPKLYDESITPDLLDKNLTDPVKIDTASSEAALSPLGDDLAKSDTNSPGFEVTALDDKLSNTHLTPSREMSVAYTKLSDSTAPEAVTGDVENFLSVHHSTQPSISNSSIQQTPKYGITVPVSPVSAETAQNQNPVNGINNVSLTALPNGHIPSTDHFVLANGLALSPNGQPNFPTIIDHIRDVQFMTHWVDCDICVYFPQSTKPAIYRNAHSLVLIRSQRLRTFIYPQRAGSYSYYIINVAPARAIDANAFDAALRFLYVDTILSAENLFPSNVSMDKTGRITALDYVVSYMIAGMELGLEPVTTRALDLVGRLLDWDLAELAVKEAMLLRSSAVATANPHMPPDTLLVAKSILQHVFNLIILRLNVQLFTADTTTIAADLTSRLAHFEGSRAAVNPALANMVFGSMPASNALSPTLTDVVSGQHIKAPNTIASVIMLNIDFEDLYSLASGLKKVHGEEGIRVIYEVVEERERRRLNILNNRSISNKQRMANAGMWDVIGWREFIFNGDLRRERVDFLLPSKRGGNNGSV